MLRPGRLVVSLLSFLQLEVVELHLVFGEVRAYTILFFLRSGAGLRVALSRWNYPGRAVGCRIESGSVVRKKVVDLLILCFDDTAALRPELLVDLGCQSRYAIRKVGRWSGVRLLVDR